MTTYRIPSPNFESFKADIEKMSRKSVKLIGKPITIKVAGTSFKKTEEGVIKIFEVELEAERPRIKGFTFVATIDHANEAGNIVRTVPNTGYTIPRSYRSVKPVCDHCRINRFRRDTFVVCEDATGEFKQVGSTCLQDFFGHDPAKIARYAELLGIADECGNGAEEYNGVGDNRYISTHKFLTYVAAAVRLFGFISRAAARDNDSTSTSEFALREMYETQEKRREIKVILDEDREMASKVMEYAANLDGDLSDYLYNLKVACSSPYCEQRTLGIIASAISAYQRSKPVTECQKTSNYVGKVSDKVEFDCEVINASSFETSFGMSHMYVFRDEHGNMLIWYASTKQKIERAQKVHVIGSVKKHSEYQGVKQTVLTRCKVAA